MKRVLFVLIAVIILAPFSIGDTTWVSSGNVTGVWDLAGSPYVVHTGDITIPTANTLIIEPGVTVLFTGNYKFIINGLLTAEGTETDSITFTRMNPTEESKWRGFRFDAADDSSRLFHCIIEYAKGTGAYPDVRGGAVWISDCSPHVAACTISNSYTHNTNYNGAGGGVCINSNSQSIIENNHILNNEADSGGGILIGQECDAIIRYNIIESNTAFYAGGGLYVSANGEGEIYGNVFESNNCSGGWGGGAINLWSATWMYGTYSNVYNNIMIGNTASTAGGAIYSRYDGSYIYNNTILSNSANEGGGIYVLTFSYLPPTIYNSIIWDNSAASGPSIFLYSGTSSAANVNYCDVQGGWPGAGNIDAEPLFTSGPFGWYYLSQTDAGQPVQSPCVDAGDPASAMITGTTRTNGIQDDGIVDMGFHYQAGAYPGWLAVYMNPTTFPIQIPPSGGSFSFEVEIVNVGGEGLFFDVWTMVLLPGGTMYGPTILRQDNWLSFGEFIYRADIQQNVPAGAPSGVYQFTLFVGEYPNPENVMATDSFPFEKLAGENVDK